MPCGCRTSVARSGNGFLWPPSPEVCFEIADLAMADLLATIYVCDQCSLGSVVEHETLLLGVWHSVGCDVVVQ